MIEELVLKHNHPSTNVQMLSELSLDDIFNQIESIMTNEAAESIFASFENICNVLAESEDAMIQVTYSYGSDITRATNIFGIFAIRWNGSTAITNSIDCMSNKYKSMQRKVFMSVLMIKSTWQRVKIDQSI